jgi:ABC-type multidrug transport system fused ATPase/permease subunit
MADENVEEPLPTTPNDDPRESLTVYTPLSPVSPGLPSPSRSSRESTRLFGPQLSCRSGRPDNLQSLVSTRKLLQPTTPTTTIDEEAQQKVVVTASQHGRAQAIRRLSALLLDPNRKENLDRLVQVRLLNYSYKVPIQMDAPTKRTVVNQSICYSIYEFARRLTDFYIPPLNKKRRWLPSKASEIWSPFSDFGVLNNVNLVFQPGQTYLVLGPPGSGKTSLLKAVAGTLPKGTSKTQPHEQGRIEYNQVTLQVSVCRG